MGTDPPAATDGLGADHRHRDDRSAGLERQPPHPSLGLPQRAGPDPSALREDQDDVPALQDGPGGGHRFLVAGAAVDRERAEGVEDPALEAVSEQLLLGHVVHRPAGHGGDHERIQEAAVVGGHDHRAAARDVLPADALHPEIDVKERLDEGPDDQIHQEAHGGV